MVMAALCLLLHLLPDVCSRNRRCDVSGVFYDEFLRCVFCDYGGFILKCGLCLLLFCFVVYKDVCSLALCIGMQVW